MWLPTYNVKWYSCFENGTAVLTVPQKITQSYPAIPLLGICPRGLKIYVHTKNVHSNIIHNSYKAETTQMPIS
jgi:hypothetical protein